MWCMVTKESAYGESFLIKITQFIDDLVQS